MRRPTHSALPPARFSSQMNTIEPPCCCFISGKAERAASGNSLRPARRSSCARAQASSPRSARTRRGRHWRPECRDRQTRARNTANAACTWPSSVTSQSSGANHVRAELRGQIGSRARSSASASRSASTTQAPSLSRRCAVAAPIPPAAPVTSAILRRPALGLRHPLQLGFFERPVFDVEGFTLVEAEIAADGLCAAHHVDGVAVELAGKSARSSCPRRTLKRPTPGTSTTTGFASRIGGSCGPCAALVIGVIATRDSHFTAFARYSHRSSRAGSSGQRRDLGAQEMIRDRRCRSRPASRNLASPRTPALRRRR